MGFEWHSLFRGIFADNHIKVYNVFKSQLNKALQNGNWNLLRGENQYLLTGDDYEFEDDLENLFTELRIKKMQPLVWRFDALQKMDTTGFFNTTSVSKLEEQTKAMKNVCDLAKFAYDKLDEVKDKVMAALNLVRLCAYRNIYLGVELINFIVENDGGKKLTTMKDSIEIKQFDSTVKVNIKDIHFNTMNSVLTNVSSAIGMLNTTLNNPQFFNYAKKNPKVASGMAVATGLAGSLQAIGEYMAEKEAKQKSIIQVQKKLIRYFSEISDGYVSAQASVRRGVEIIQAIVKANKGFMHIYAPLGKKVFEEGDWKSVTELDLRQLAKAMNEYNKITQSKLKNS